MSFEITLNIAENSPEGQNIENLAESEQISREAAARKLLSVSRGRSAASPEARSIIGAARDDAALMDEVMELVMSERQRHNAEPPRV